MQKCGNATVPKGWNPQGPAVSVAAVRGRRLLIGQIFGYGILDCTME